MPASMIRPDTGSRWKVDRKSTRLNSSHANISYAVFCLKKKNDDRPGGALTIGLDMVAKSPPDGYTIGMGPIGGLAITRHMVAKMPFDIERDLQPICLLTRGHLLLAVSPKLQVNSVQELIDYAKKNPGKLTNASSSNGS